MSAPEQGTSGSNPDDDHPAVEFETTGLWPIDDPEQTSHIQRPPATPPTSPAAAPPAPASTTPTPAPPAAGTSPAPHVDPEATSIVPRPTGNYTQPWPAAPPSPPPHTPAPGPAPGGYAPPPYDPAGGYHQQHGGYPQGAGYHPATGYPQGTSGYPPSPGYPLPQQPGPAEFAATNYDFTSEITTRAGRRRTALLTSAAVAVIAIAGVGITGFWKPGFFVTRQLNIAKVQEGVQHILTDPTTGYGITGVSGVICNDGRNPSGDKGTKFGCELSVAGGAKHHVEVTVVDDKGTYQVGKIS